MFLATRGSPLALAQANAILAQCRAAFPKSTFELKIIKTTGDKMQTASLAGAELPKGLFTKELEVALLNGEASLAVHSLKDLPTELPPGLKLGATPPRADVRDVLVYRDLEFVVRRAEPLPLAQKILRGFRPHVSIRSLPHGAVVATSSTRRAAQVSEQRPDVKIVPMRGNVGTRLRKLAEQNEIDATILAAAGLHRLQFQLMPDGRLSGEEISAGLAATPISLSEMLPCVGQAAIGIEIRANDSRSEEICARLNEADTFHCVTAERAFLHAMGGGCQAAVAAVARVEEGRALRLQAVSYLNQRVRRGETRGAASEAVSLGEELARKLLRD